MPSTNATEPTREALATTAARPFTADATVAVLDGLVTTLGRRPQHIRTDNGPELTAHALADWCRYSGVDPAFIDPGSPWQNGTCESFNGRFRDELLVCEQFNTLLEVQVLAEDWRIEYNTYRPHGSLGGLTPETFHQQWINNHEMLSHKPWTKNRDPVRCRIASVDVGFCSTRRG